jgi:hypothetical protein
MEENVMAFPMALLAPLVGVGEKVIDKIWPDPETAARAKIELANELANIDLKQDQSFRDFIVAYEGRGDQVHPIIQILRGSVRPVITYTLAGFFLYGFVQGPSGTDPDTMTMLWQLNLISMGFWYGERALKNLGVGLGGKS